MALALMTCRPAADTVGTVLAEGWSTATDVVVLDIPADCPAQRLEYAGWQVDAARPSSLAFVVSQLEEEVIAAATGDFADYMTGAADWRLAAGVYALTVRGVNARWRFAVTCQ